MQLGKRLLLAFAVTVSSKHVSGDEKYDCLKMEKKKNYRKQVQGFKISEGTF